MEKPDYNDVPEKPYWPPPSEEVEAAVGRVVIAWGVLESQLDAIICQLLRVEFSTAAAVSANWPAQQKLNSIRSLAHTLLRDDDHPKFKWNTLVDDINKLAGKTSGAASKWRNVVAHGQPFPVSKTPENDLVVGDTGIEDLLHVWIHLGAGKGGVSGPMFHLSALTFDKARDDVRELVESWHAVRLRLVECVEVLNFSDDRRF